ncbi:MAG: PIN domain-containing protein, partial [Bacteroidales bacterium]|nr:PIN domain-containing protein [Bacteroidales bacterium]
MIRYVLDTNVLVDILRNKPKGVREKLVEIGIDHCVISDISIFELYSGVAASANPENNKELLESMFKHLG